MTEKQVHRQVSPQPCSSASTPNSLNTADKPSSRSRSMSWLYLVFFVSGFPALLYQIVWQRAVANNTMHWRTYSSDLLSREYLQLIRTRLKPGGMYYFNTTWSPEAQRTAAEEFPYGFRVKSMMLVSDTPIAVNLLRWRNLSQTDTIDGASLFVLEDPAPR